MIGLAAEKSSASYLKAQIFSFAPLLLIVVAFSIHCLPYFSYHMANNEREIYTYSLDAKVILRDVIASSEAPKFRLDFTGYGQLYYNIAILAKSLFSKFFLIGEGETFRIIRLVSFAGAILTIVLTFILTRRFLGAAIATFCAGQRSRCLRPSYTTRSMLIPIRCRCSL